MTGAIGRLAELEAAIGPTGLVMRGGFHPHAEDGVPAYGPAQATATVLLLGNTGGSLWSAFAAAPELADARPDPLDRWSRRVIDGLAKCLDARAVYPFDGPPWFPFQRWASRAEPVFASPIGPLIHPRHGLWHAYRGALLFSRHIELPPRECGESPCPTCESPCLHTCPVNALQAGRYDVSACVSHIETAAGADCLTQGCRARHACPVAVGSPYPVQQQELHMRAFLEARRGAESQAKIRNKSS